MSGIINSSNSNNDDNEVGEVDMDQQSLGDIECDISDGDEHAIHEDIQVESEGDKEMMNMEANEDMNEMEEPSTTNEEEEEELIQTEERQFTHNLGTRSTIPPIDVYTYMASQSQMGAHGGAGDIDAIMLYESPTDAKSKSKSKSAPVSSWTDIAPLNSSTAFRNPAGPMISDINCSSSNNNSNESVDYEVNIQNPQDPLYLSHWPTHIWPRTTVLQPLPPVDEINRILGQTDTNKPGAVVYLCQQTLRREGNLALEMSLWLAAKLQLPLIALVRMFIMIYSYLLYLT